MSGNGVFLGRNFYLMGATSVFYQHKWSYPKMATQLSSLKITNVMRQMTANTNEFRKNKLLKKLD